MKEIAPGVYQLKGRPRNAINVYLVGDTLVDAGTRLSFKRILRELGDRKPRAHVVTHAHADHQGSSHAVCSAFEIPLACGERDAQALRSGELIGKSTPANFLTRLGAWAWAGPAHPVDRTLRDGDEVEGFTVIDTPGHSPGHISLWRPGDGVLILGDVLTNIDIRTGIPGLHFPLDLFTPDPAENVRSARRVADLEPSLICFGHGAPLRDTDRFTRFVRAAPG